MVYKEANLVLGSSLSPNNRGICKKTAIQNNAQETPLASFAQNRLVPASVVAKKYYVVFLDEGGTVIGSGYYEPGAALNDPGVPPKAGHTGAWNNGYTGYATGDVTYSPVYTPISYTITFYDSSAFGGGQLQQLSVPYGTTPSPNSPSHSGYTFNGWSPSLHPVTGEESYTATYSIVSHTVTFISDGSTYNTQYVQHGGYATDPGSPTKSGYVFAGWSPSVASTQINGDTTFTAQFTVAVTMLADVGWKTADAGQGTPHGDPNNEYELDSQWIPSNKIPINVWFEPMYTSNGTELSYTDPIATVNGVSVSHNDLTWSASLGTSDQGYEYWDNGTYGSYRCVIIMPQQLNPEQGPTNRNWRATVQSNSSELYWMDEFPFYLTGTYNGITVVQKTMKIVCYKYIIDQAGGPYSSTYKAAKYPWVKNWLLN